MINKVYNKALFLLRKYHRIISLYSKGIHYLSPNFIYQPNFDSSSIIIDAGCSYEAELSKYMIEKYGVLAYGVDPTRKHSAALRKFESDSNGKFFYKQVAVGSTDTNLTFYESLDNESGSMLSNHVNVISDRTTSYDVRCISLPSLLKEFKIDKIDLLKLDLEGAEYELIENIVKSDLKNISQLFIEFHHHAIEKFNYKSTTACVNRIENFGYKSYTTDDHNYLFIRT